MTDRRRWSWRKSEALLLVLATLALLAFVAKLVLASQAPAWAPIGPVDVGECDCLPGWTEYEGAPVPPWIENVARLPVYDERGKCAEGEECTGAKPCVGNLVVSFDTTREMWWRFEYFTAASGWVHTPAPPGAGYATSGHEAGAKEGVLVDIPVSIPCDRVQDYRIVVSDTDPDGAGGASWVPIWGGRFLCGQCAAGGWRAISGGKGMKRGRNQAFFRMVAETTHGIAPSEGMKQIINPSAESTDRVFESTLELEFGFDCVCGKTIRGSITPSGSVSVQCGFCGISYRVESISAKGLEGEIG